MTIPCPSYAEQGIGSSGRMIQTKGLQEKPPQAGQRDAGDADAGEIGYSTQLNVL